MVMADLYHGDSSLRGAQRDRPDICGHGGGLWRVMDSNGCSCGASTASVAMWDPVSFVHSTRDILARCMREKGVEPGTAAQLLSGLPETFDQWKQTSPPARSVQVDHPSDPADLSDPADVMDALMGPAALLGGPIGPIAPIGPTGPAA